MQGPDPGQLIVELAGNVVQTLSLDVPVLSIGRLPDNGLSLPHPAVSRHHAELRGEIAGLLLTDLGSANGTQVAGVPLLPNQPRLLADGEAFQIGPFTLTYHAAGTSHPAAAEAAPVTPVDLPLSLAEPAASIQTSPSAVPVVLAPPRPSYPAPGAQATVSSYLRDLPVIFQGNDFLGRFLLIFESIWEPLEQRQDHLAAYVDPHTCPASFLPWLASWLGLALDQHWPEGRSRRLLSEAMDVYRWRGTRYGLVRMLELCTGLTAQVSESPAEPFVFRLSLTIPPNSGVTRGLVESLIQAHKPAHAGYVLQITP